MVMKKQKLKIQKAMKAAEQKKASIEALHSPDVWLNDKRELCPMCKLPKGGILDRGDPREWKKGRLGCVFVSCADCHNEAYQEN